MKREEIVERIEWLETQLFRLAMIDRWTAKTYEADRKFNKELVELKKLAVNF